MQKYNNTKIIIGLDHGYGNIKTAHRVFRTGVECFEEEPIVSVNYIKYKDKYYVIGGKSLNLSGEQDRFAGLFYSHIGRIGGGTEIPRAA